MHLSGLLQHLSSQEKGDPGLRFLPLLNDPSAGLQEPAWISRLDYSPDSQAVSSHP